MLAESGRAVEVRFALPAPALAPFVTTFYCTEVNAAGPGGWMEDHLHPEWANLRFLAHAAAQQAIGAGALVPSPLVTLAGPTSRATRFRLAEGRAWGVGLLPAGWAALFGAQAGDYADRFVDALADPAFAALGPLAEELAATTGGFDAELAVVIRHVERLLEGAAPDPAITRLTAALVDPDLATVAELAERMGMTVRSLERLARRAFGFPPKLLIRRQRFLRSLAQYMLDPSLKWLTALDWQYHDQSHFVRDFKRFMGMSPSAYARLDKPLLSAAARARMKAVGQAMQGLHRPVGDLSAGAAA
ncbi:helix-turn-helix domain-containing protein [Erythrobacter sp. NE805]|uniref:helix-turn-helix domain-containing protein n=1 Tax=Erythrobacter sp. NE805 TaxID=3389875 RepID=UPI00396B4154